MRNVQPVLLFIARSEILCWPLTLNIITWNLRIWTETNNSLFCVVHPGMFLKISYFKRVAKESYVRHATATETAWKKAAESHHDKDTILWPNHVCYKAVSQKSKRGQTLSCLKEASYVFPTNTNLPKKIKPFFLTNKENSRPFSAPSTAHLISFCLSFVSSAVPVIIRKYYSHSYRVSVYYACRCFRTG